MEAKRKNILSITFGFATFGCIFGTIAFFSEGVWQNFLINLASEFIGVSIIFIIVHLFFDFDPEGRLFSQIKNLLNKLDQSTTKLFDKSTSRTWLALNESVKKGNQLDLLGTSLYTLIKDLRSDLIEAVNRGLDVRIILLDPEGEIGNYYKQAETTAARFLQQFALTLDNLRSIFEEVRDSRVNFNVKTLDHVSTCTMIIIDRDDDGARLGLGFYPTLGKIRPERFHLLISKKENNSSFSAFVEQFETLWKAGESLDLQKINDLLKRLKG